VSSLSAAVAQLGLVRSVRPTSFLAILAIAIPLCSCSRSDDSYVWAELPHAISPSGWCVAYLQEAKQPPTSGWSAVLLDLDRGKCSATAVEFHQVSVPLKMQWLDPTTLEISYPKDVSPVWPCDTSEHVVDCAGRRVRVVLLRI